MSAIPQARPAAPPERPSIPRPATAPPAAPASAPASRADAYKRQVLAVVVVGSFMAALSTTMINLAITVPAILLTLLLPGRPLRRRLP